MAHPRDWRTDPKARELAAALIAEGSCAVRDSLAIGPDGWHWSEDSDAGRALDTLRNRAVSRRIGFTWAQANAFWHDDDGKAARRWMAEADRLPSVQSILIEAFGDPRHFGPISQARANELLRAEPLWCKRQEAAIAAPVVDRRAA